MKYISLVIFMAILTTTLSAQEKIAFTVSFSEPQAHYADIEMEISGLKDNQVDLKMPVWAPGSYLIREFAKNVESFKAVDNSGKSLSANKIDKNTWRVNNVKGSIKVSYRVYSNEISVRTSFVDESHAFLSPTGIFLYPAGKLQLPSTVTIIPHKGWTKISTGLDKVAAKENTYSAPNYDILYDSPIEVGNQDIFYFDAAGVAHEVAMYGGGNYDKEVLKRDMAKIVHEQTKVFGVNPNKRYVFIVHNFNSGGGGLEHLNSTVLGASRNAYNTEAGLLRFLSLVSHEYFHLWNVKRLRPIALGPFNYDEENYTTNLWIAEGFTAYYQDVFTMRAGLLSSENYISGLASAISALENQPGNKIQTLSESSFDAWIKQYRPNENSNNSTISYYSKGALVALIMDLEIIHSTKGKAGLDEVMKAMYDEYYVKQKRGYTDKEFKEMAEKIAGHSLNDMYDNYVNGLKTIDYDKYLNYAGLGIKNEAEKSVEPFLGISTSLREGKMYISQVARGSGAWNDGLNVNDEILSIDSYQIKNTRAGSVEMLKYIATRKVGEKVKVTVIRDGMEKAVEVSLGKSPSLKYSISPTENPSVQQMAVRKRWLKL
ncbi:MAG: PDZ domain-containing protein [Daejeonella sp.]|uniref:M61 family metallopeptidase n=1 Tax=Daejeonella sp. TaxID=2805397 RepID=UPI003C747F61